MGSQRPGPACTTHGDYVDAGTACLTVSPIPGTACTVLVLPPVPPRLKSAVDTLEAEAVAFASRFIDDLAVREQYMAGVARMSEEVLDEVRSGAITAEEGVLLANQLRNELMQTARIASSDVGRAWAEMLKAQGRTLLELQEKYAQRLFSRAFDALQESERNEVFLAIIQSSGQGNSAVLATSVRLAKFARGVLFVTVALAVYQVLTSDDPGREAAKQGTVIVVGAGGAALFGTAAASSLLCGPGAPICVGILVFVGGGAAAFGAGMAFDHLFPEMSPAKAPRDFTSHRPFMNRLRD